MKRIVFLGAKEIGYHCLHYLLENKESLQIELAAVLTNQTRKLAQAFDLVALAQGHQIPLLTSLDELSALDPFDLLISVQYHEILKQKHIDLARELAINLHMAPLPEYRGCNQFTFAILENQQEFGTTLHRLEAGVDNGAIIAERRFPIEEGSFVAQLYENTLQYSKTMFEEEIGNIVLGNYQLIPQESLVEERGTSFHLRKEISDVKLIDLNWSEERIYRHIRATYMPGFEPPYAMVGNQKISFSIEEFKR